jgi:beta-hydroxylase
MDAKQLLGERLFKKAFHKHSLLGDKKFFNPHDVALSKDLLDNYQEIKKEVDAILARYDDLAVFQNISANQSYIVNDDKWRMFFFRVFGVNVKKNQSITPVIASVINKHDNIVSAYISVLGPQTYLNPHHGPWSGIIRMHLGVVVPGHNQCALIVEGETYHWKEGEIVLFDDTFEHMALNATDKPRAILFFDIDRPLPQPWKFFGWLVTRLTLFTPYCIKGYLEHRKWQKQFFKERK